MKRPGWPLLLTAVLAMAPAGATFASVAEQPETPAWQRFLEQDYLLGDWGGLRTELSERGVDFEFFYAGSVPNNLDGGIRRGAVYQGALMMWLELDSEKLAGYSGGTFHAGSIWLHGEKPFSEEYIGDLNKVNLVDFDNGFRLWELYYEQRLWDNRFSIKAGQISIDRDFIVPEYYNSLATLSLLNQTFFYPTMAFNVYDQPFLPVGHHALASTPYGVPGVRLRFDPIPRAYIQAGVYDGKPDFSESGTRVRLGGDEGALIYFELGWKVNQEEGTSGPPGNVKVGGYYHTDEFVDMYEGAFNAFDNFVAANGIPLPPLSPGPARFRNGNYGVYGLVDQVLWREVGEEDPAMQGLTGFFRAAYAPEDRNLAQFSVDGGLVYKGLIPTRDWDTLALAVSYMEMSDDLRRAQRDINAILLGGGGPPAFTKLADYEAVVELSYKAQMAAWWTLQPSVQRVIHPGGRVISDIPDAWAFIIQTTLRF
mgnify:FL=1